MRLRLELAWGEGRKVLFFVHPVDKTIQDLERRIQSEVAQDAPFGVQLSIAGFEIPSTSSIDILRDDETIMLFFYFLQNYSFLIFCSGFNKIGLPQHSKRREKANCQRMSNWPVKDERF
jgi:hypothetical protein